MRKFVNDPRHVVREMLEGLADLSPGLALIADAGVVVRADLPAAPEQRRVAILSGGGSGHEPAHAGYVGPGLLHAAIAGDVFTSPGVDAVLTGIRAAAGPAGAVLVVKNYTGDRLNFGLAAELARAQGISCEIVVVADDVALRDTVAPERRRGIAGTILVHKIAGAAAAAGACLAEVAAEARAAATNIGSIGVALGPCTVPAAGTASFELAVGDMELGLGIHGEPGVRRTARLPADALVTQMIAAICDDRALRTGEPVALLVNGLGGTPPMELAIIARHALATLRSRGLVVERAWCGSFLTALEMPGCSLSLMRLDAQRLTRLDAPAAAVAWPGGGRISAERRTLSVAAGGEPSLPDAAANPVLRAGALAIATALEAAEPELTALDSATGDGDLGLSMSRAAAAIRALPDAAWSSPAIALRTVAAALRKAIGGSSGPFYATALLRAAATLATAEPDPRSWSTAFAAGVAAIADLGGARPGDRTMLDALYPAARAFEAAAARGAPPGEIWQAVLGAAEAGAAATAQMHPRLGRASFLGERAIGHRDAGAQAAVVWLRAITPGGS